MIAKYTSLEGMTEHRTDNGLRVLLIPDPSQATVTVNLTIFAGSAYEDYGETGAAHLLEHLAFKGSPDFPDPPGALNEHGASWNGTTWTDRTNYYETMPASDENLDFGIHFEASRLVGCFIRRSDLDSEMTVVRNEFESGENYPTQVLCERLMSAAFAFHGYGHSTIGARSDIEKIPIERLQGFYRTWYRTDNSQLVVAGRFDEEKALAAIERHFGAIPAPTEPLKQVYTVEPPQDGERSVTLRRVGEVSAAAALYHVPGASHPDTPVTEVLAEILAASPSGRLYDGLVETGRAVRVSGTVFLFKEPGVMLFQAEVRKDGSVEAVRDEMLATIERLADEEPTPAELERARNSLVKERTLVFGNSERLAIEMSEWAAMGDWRLFFVHRRALESVTAADVKRVAQTYLKRSNRTVGLYLPTPTVERAEIPANPEIEALVAGLTESAPTESEPPMALTLEADQLEQRTTRSTVVDSGVGLALLAKRTRGGLVSGQIQLAVGDEKALIKNTELNDWVASMLDRGTKRLDHTALKDELDRLHADVRVHGGVNDTIVSFTTTRATVGEVVDRIFEMLREPRFDAGELELLRRERLAELEEARHEPQALAGAALGTYLFPVGHIRHGLSLEEQASFAESLALETLVDFHRDFYGAAEGHVALVGDHDAEAIAERVGANVSGWKSVELSQRVAVGCPAPAAPIVQEIDCPGKENALTVAGRTFVQTRDEDSYPALQLANYMLGGEALASRLSMRLRQKEGLCYGAGSSIWVDSRGDLGSFTFWAISAPQNAARVEVGFREEVARLRADGFAEAELERARGVYLEQVDVRLARDSILASEMVDMMVRGRTFTELDRFRTRMRAVTLDQVNAVVRDKIDPDAMALFRAGAFAG